MLRASLLTLYPAMHLTVGGLHALCRGQPFNSLETWHEVRICHSYWLLKAHRLLTFTVHFRYVPHPWLTKGLFATATLTLI